MTVKVAYEFTKMASSSYSYSYSDSEDELGSGGYLDSEEEEEEEEGSSWDEKEFSVKVVEVEGGADLVGGWAPGGLHQACAVALREEEKRAVFIVTGGRLTSAGGGVGKCHKGIVQMEGKGRARVGEGQDCGNLVHPRRQHGCTLATIGGSEAAIVAGGLGTGDSPVMQVEFLVVGGNPWARNTFIQPWRVLGQLNRARFGFPTVGEILGQLVVAGGKTTSNLKFNSETLDIDPDTDAAETSIEVNIATKEKPIIREHSIVILNYSVLQVYEESMGQFRLAGLQDRLGKQSLSLTRYDFAGVTFPKSWCT